MSQTPCMSPLHNLSNARIFHCFPLNKLGVFRNTICCSITKLLIINCFTGNIGNGCFELGSFKLFLCISLFSSIPQF